MNATLLASLLLLPISIPVSGQERDEPEADPEPVMEVTTSAFPSDEELHRLLETRIAEKRLHGVVLGLIEADGSRRVLALGDAGAGAEPLCEESVFEIGSITKAFTGILLAEMHGRGEVDMSAAAQAVAPEGLTIPERGGKAITLELLATQRSGLPRLPDNMRPEDPTNPYADYSVEQLHAFVSEHVLTRDPGAAYEYSNLGSGLLGHLLAHRAGKGYEELLRERILGPLGMEATGIELRPEMRSRLAIGHDPSGEPAPNWDLPTLAGAGALRSNLSDMLDFLAANLGEPQDALGQAMRESHRARNFAGEPKVGLGWHLLEAEGRTVVWHNGGTGGYRAFAGFDPDRGIGVVILNNSTSSPDDIGFHLLAGTPLAPAPPPPLVREEIQLAAEDLAKFAGEYALEVAPDFHLVFTVEDGVLMLTPTGQPKTAVHPESPVKFFSRIVDAQFEFLLGEDGKPVALILHQHGEHRARRLR